MCKRILSLVLALALMLGMAALADAPEKALKLYSFTNDEGVLELGISYDDKLLFSTPCEGTAPWLMLDKIDGEMILFIYTNKLSRVTLVDMAQEGASTKHFPPIELDGVWSDVCIAQNAGEITLNVLKDCIIEKLTLLETVSLNQLGYISEIFTPESGEEAYTDAVLAFADKLSEALIAAEDDPELDDTIVINAKAKKSNAPKLPACGNKNHKIDDGWDHSKAECGIPGHFNCDEYEHVCCEGCGEWECESFDAHYECSFCGEYLCDDDHKAEDCAAEIENGCGIEDHNIYDQLDHRYCETCKNWRCNGDEHEVECGCGTAYCSGQEDAYTHGVCPNCGEKMCQSQILICEHCHAHLCEGDHAEAACSEENHYACDGDHSEAACGTDDHYNCDELDHARAACGTVGHYNCDDQDHAEAGCEVQGHYNCDGNCHDLCDHCNNYICKSDIGLCEHCGQHACSTEHTPADCKVDGHYSCDGETHTICEGCNKPLCSEGEHVQAECGHYKCAEAVFIPENHAECPGCGMRPCAEGYEGKIHELAPCKLHYQCMTGYNELEHAGITTCIGCGKVSCSEGEHGQADCKVPDHYKCDGRTHSKCPGCDMLLCDTNYDPANHAEAACDTQGHYKCDDLDHSEAGCKVTGHFNCDGKMHLCQDCDVAICQDPDHGH